MTKMCKVCKWVRYNGDIGSYECRRFVQGEQELNHTPYIMGGDPLVVPNIEAFGCELFEGIVESGNTIKRRIKDPERLLEIISTMPNPSVSYEHNHPTGDVVITAKNIGGVCLYIHKPEQYADAALLLKSIDKVMKGEKNGAV